MSAWYLYTARRRRTAEYRWQRLFQHEPSRFTKLRPPSTPLSPQRRLAAGTSWRELLQDLELRLDLDLGSEDDSEDREYVRRLFEAEYAEAMSYEGHD